MASILAVDDSTSVRQMVAYTLKSAGYNVVEAVDGEDGLQHARRTQMDLVLIDQNMPRMDGLTMVRELRAMARYRSTPILILTTECSDEMKAAGKDAGATGWMVKPFNPPRLLEIIDKVLQSSRSRPAGAAAINARPAAA